MATEAEILASRRRRAEQLRQAGVELFPARIPRPLDRLPELIERHGETNAEALERDAPEATVAGRIMSLRSFGKAAFLMLQAEGDYAGTAEFLDRYGVASESLLAAIVRLGDVPVDIRPVYPQAEELAPTG